MAVNGRRKGSKAERVLAEAFTKWTSKKFSRVPSSGGLHWKSSYTSGDITCTEEGHYFPFSVECKSYKEINFTHLLYDVNSDVMKWWQQCYSDAQKHNKIPLLFMRANGMPKGVWFTMLLKEHWKLIWGELGQGHYFQYVTNNVYIIGHSKIIFSSDYRKVRKKLLNITKYANRPK